VCCLPGGLFRRTLCRQWIHLLCAVWLLPETSVLEGSKMDGWNIAKIAPWRSRVSCSICGRPDGFVVRCSGSTGEGHDYSASSCSATFHPMCAYLSGLATKLVTTCGAWESGFTVHAYAGESLLPSFFIRCWCA